MKIQIRIYQSVIPIGLWHSVLSESIYYTQLGCPRNKAIRFHHGTDTLKEHAIELFLFNNTKPEDGKVYEFNDPVDCEFLKLAARVPASNWRFWAKIRDKIKQGCDKQEIIEQLSLKAITRALE